MSRRSGQNPQPVIHGDWWTIRFWIDVSGQETRVRVRRRICPASGPGKLTKSEIARKAKEIIQKSGADSVEHFEKCVASLDGTTFRQQAERWLIEQTTKENPIAPATASSYRCYLSKWLNPNLGDLPLCSIKPITIRDILAPRFREANLAPKTRLEITAVVKLVMASLVGEDLQPVHKILWPKPIKMGLPEVEEQHRPKLKAERITEIVSSSAGRYRALAVLLAGSGLRIGEALAIKLYPATEDHTTISADFKTVYVRKSVRGTQEQKPKTKNAIRSVDLGTSVTAVLKEFAGGRKSGFLFRSDSGLPLLQSNILRDWLHKHGVEGFHTFRRFRTPYLRKCGVPWDLVKFWIGHANKDVTDRYAEQLQEDVAYRQEWAEKVGLGFTLGPSNPSNVVSIPHTLEAAAA